MIIVNLKGGLGNQMFQYALGRKLAQKNNDLLKLDTDGLRRANELGDIYRPFSLEQFNIIKNIAEPEEVRALKYPFGIISKGLRWSNLHILRRTHTVYEKDILEKTGDIFLDGFWQSPLYFTDIKEILLKEFTLSKPFSEAGAIFAEQIKNSPAVALHVRRGDYIKNPRVEKEFGPCSLDFYKNAMAEIEKVLPEPTYFVFSDDLPWVKENLPLGNKAVFVKGTGMTDAEDLILMSMCQHNIIANSSFSWWSGWLNPNPNKVVIAPTPWFNLSPYDKNLIPESWLQLPK
ncbi:MAG: alpha-1,2-fucosyltransferase [Candidatus Paceibacterota bacterium]